MLIRVHPPMTVLYNSRQASMAELPDLSGTVIRDLYKYVADLDLLVCGPQYWFYYGVDGRPETRFTVEIALPVQGRIPTSLLAYFKQTPAFKCLCHRHEGSWEGLPGTYNKMMEHISSNGLKMNGIYAESFLHIDLDDPANQVTEIQIGVL